MSKTIKKFAPRPYFNSVVDEELYNEDEEATIKAQNTDDNDDDPSDTAGRDTRRSTDPATSDEDTYEKRWKDLKKHYDTEVSTLRRKIKEMEEENDPSFKPPKTVEELESFRKQYPEFYDVMLSVAHQNGSQFASKTDGRIQELEAKLAEAEQEKAFKLIEQAHPDYVKVVADKQFMEWLDKQDSTIQSWVKENSSNAQSFIRALDLYKLDAGLAKPPTTRKRGTSNETSTSSSAALDVSVGSGGVQVGDTNKRIWSRAEINRMTPKDFDKYEEELMAAMMEGRVR